jgi:hypothetical protein
MNGTEQKEINRQLWLKREFELKYGMLQN